MPNAVPLGVDINVPDLEFVIADVDLGVARDHRGIPELTDFHVFPLDGPVVGAARRNGVYERGFSIDPGCCMRIDQIIGQNLFKCLDITLGHSFYAPVLQCNDFVHHYLLQSKLPT